MNSRKLNKSIQKFSVHRKARDQRAQGILFIELALLLPMLAVIAFGLAYYGNAYVTKTRLGDTARVIARAIQDDPSISQGNWSGNLGDLDRVVLAATGISDALPADFNVATYRSCNPDISNWTDSQLREHFARAGRYENRGGALGSCDVREVGSRYIRVNIKSYATSPSSSEIAAQFNQSSSEFHPSGRNLVPNQLFGWRYSNPNTDPSQPYWIAVVAKKPVRQLSLFGWTFGSNSEIVNNAVVRVVPKSAIRADYSNCRKVSNTGGPPLFVSTITCEPGEILAAHTASCEVPGSGICASTSKGFMHTNAATLTSATVDCFSDNWVHEACSYVEGYCCPTSAG